MTDIDLIKKKLAFIETCVRELREIANPDLIEQDIREERFVAHTLQIAIQAAQDVSSHIVSDLRLGEPSTNRELFEILNRNSWISDKVAEMMAIAVGFRNVVVHGYEALDVRIMKNILLNHLEDLLSFVAEIRRMLDSLS